MAIIAPGYNVEGSPAAGFVKNDGSGNFLFGEPGGGGGGIGTGWELVEKKDITVDTTSITFSGLDGDTDEQYMLIMHEVTLASAGADYKITMRPNGVTTQQQTFEVSSPSSSGFRATSNFTDLRWRSTYQRARGQAIDTTMWLSSKSGSPRNFRTYQGSSSTPKTFPSGSGVTMSTLSWEDTSTNITSLDIVASTAGGIGAGSTYCLYKKSAGESGGPGSAAWKLVEKKVIASDTTSITFSGLDGDTDEQYMFIMHEAALVSAGASYQIRMRPNGATTLQQTFIIASPSSTGGRFTSNFTDLRWRSNYQRAQELVVNTTIWFYAKSGDVRLLHAHQGAGGMLSNTFPSGLGITTITGQWDDTVANITFIDIVASVTGGLGVGSVYCLYKLR